MNEIKEIITETWQEEVLANIFGEESIAVLKYPTDINNKENTELNDFNKDLEYLEVTLRRIPK